MDDWYNVTQDGVHRYGGKALLCNQYNDSLSAALLSVYPEHHWMLWRFSTLPSGLKKRMDVQQKRKMLDWLGKKLNIKELK